MNVSIAMKKSGYSDGFTLIELLIVIALLGALAIGLIGAIDPFEQLKKGTDTATRNTVSEFHNSIVRFFALRGHMPWCTSADSCSDPVSGTKLSNIAGTDLDQANSVIARIVETGELKANFIDIHANELDKIYLYGTSGGGNDTAVVCFRPTSKSLQNEANSSYLQDGTRDDVNCPMAGKSQCYWCIQ